MAKKRSAELDREIQESLARISKKSSIKTPEQLDAEIDAILSSGSRAERYEIAGALGFRYPKRSPPKKMTLTGTNLFALTEKVLEAGGRSTFSNRVPQSDHPHINRCVIAGLATVGAGTLTLTPAGVEAVLTELRTEIARNAQFVRNVGPADRRIDARYLERQRKVEAAIKALEA